MMNNKTGNIAEMMFYLDASMSKLKLQLIDFKKFF